MAELILTSGGLAFMRDCWAAQSRDVMPQPPLYIALSSGTTPSSLALGRFATSLPGETFRSPIISRDVVENTVTFRCFLSTDDNISQTVSRYGIIGGNDADSQPGGGGALLAVQNDDSPFSKDSTKTLAVALPLTISGTVS